MKSISSDDLKEYFMGKLQIYTIEKLKSMGLDYNNQINDQLEQLVKQQDQIFEASKALRAHFNKFRSASFRKLNNHDVEKISNVFQLF